MPAGQDPSDTLLTMEDYYNIVYDLSMAATAVTLNDTEGQLQVAGLFKCNPSNICDAFYTTSTESVYFTYLLTYLTSHSTHYRSFQGWYLQARWPNQQCQSTEGNQLVIEIRLESHQNRLYTQCKGPNVTNQIRWTCKNCWYKYAADCEHCVTQSSTSLFW